MQSSGGGIQCMGTVAVLFACHMLGACGGGTTAAIEPQTDLTSCIPLQSAHVGPVNDPNGPYFHQVIVARTTDGLSITPGLQALVHASVPDAVRGADGAVTVYYVDGARGSIWAARVVGDTAIPLGAITIDGIAAPAGVVDPDVLLQPNGKVRLTYLSGFGTPSTSNARSMCIADTDDGLHFTVRAVAYAIPSGELLTDPSLVRLANGTWLMAMSLGGSTVLAHSADGLSFTRDQTLTFGGVPELGLAPDGALRLYVCGQGIVAYRSTNGGQNWQMERVVLTPGSGGQHIVCDPSLVAGTDYFIYKVG